MFVGFLAVTTVVVTTVVVTSDDETYQSLIEYPTQDQYENGATLAPFLYLMQLT